ncbi:hypothetical protein HHK36_026808 [Tetracentron sinense]|uniref:Uncharacterized protein n=1 Tax=Tetracentron sinense TaxID=13715 RepID=A0A835D4Y7_TETSI|nr:hypothetical protein HHK36_026808 [Tetracentron sinense]
MIDLIDGSYTAPPPTIELSNPEEGKRLTLTNPAYIAWSKKDQLFLSWIHATITPTVFSQVVRFTTARDTWLVLERSFASQTTARQFQIRTELQSIKKGQLSISDYLEKIKSLADELAAIQQPLPERELVFCVLHGLDFDYHPFITTVTNGELPSFEELYGMLLSQEIRLNEYHNSHSTSALFTTRDRGRGRGPRGRGNNRGGHFRGRGREQRQHYYSNRPNTHPHQQRSFVGFPPQTTQPPKMGAFMSRFWFMLFPAKEYKIVVVGLDNAGKTTTLYKLHLGEVVTTHPTVGSNVEELVYKNIRFEVWDLGGQERLRTSWATYYRGTHAVIAVIDSTDRARISIMKDELFRLLQHEDVEHSVVLIFANKQDLKDAMSPAEITDNLSLHSIKNHDWHIQACCALTGEGLYDGLGWIAQRVTGKATS